MTHKTDQKSRPGLADLFERFMSEEAAVRGQIDKNARALAQSALARLDVVSREEFDAQCEVLEKTRARVQQLEQLLEDMSHKVSAIESGSPDSD